MTVLVQPIPVRDKIADDKGVIAFSWFNWLNGLVTLLAAALQRVNFVTLSGQAASISATDFSGGNLATGLYLATYQFRLTQAASTSSSLAITLAWTDGGTAMSFAGTAVTTNTITSYQTGTLLLYVDSSTAVTYATTYASVGVTPMQYALRVALVKVA